MIEPSVERIVVDIRQNRLILELDTALPVVGEVPALIDIGALGRLLGLEVAGSYLGISDPAPGSELQGRSMPIGVEVADTGRQLILPRRGPGWELSFPSGNQCWARSDGDGGSHTLCAALVGP